jgi:hypothetical protein
MFSQAVMGYILYIPFPGENVYGLVDTSSLVIQGIHILKNSSEVNITVIAASQNPQGFIIDFNCDTDYSGYFCECKIIVYS